MSRKRIKATVLNVGTDWVKVLVEGKPAKYIIHRARAESTTSSSAQVAMRVIEDENYLDSIDIVLEYGLTQTPLDSSENIYFQAKRRSSNLNTLGTTIFEVKSNQSNQTIKISLDIEPIL